MKKATGNDKTNDLASLGPEVFRRLADASADGISMARLDSQIVYANASILRLLGLTDPGQMLDRSFYDFCLPDEAARLRDVIIPQVLASGEWTGEMKLISPSGIMWQTAQNIFLIRDPGGAPVAFANIITDITEYKAMDAVLAHSYQLLEAVFDSTDLLVAYLDRDMNFLMVNRAYARADGREPSFFAGRNHFELYPHPENEKLFRRSVETGEPCKVLAKPFEYSDQPERGVTYWDWSLSPTRDAAGQISGVVLTLLDVTERIRATESLYISQAAIESSINAIAIVSLDSKITYVNPAFVDLWRLNDPSNALGRSPLECWANPQDAQAVLNALQQQGHWQGELLARRQDDTLVELQLSAYLVRDAGGHPVCMLSSFADISARKQAEQQLLRSEALLTSIIEHMPAMVFLKRASDLRFELLNRTGEELLGLDKAALLGKTDHDLFPPEQAGAFTAKDREVLASGLPQDIPQESILARNGETRILHTRKMGVYDAAGEPVYLLGISLDVTEQKKTEAALLLQREFASKLLNAAPVIVVVLDPHGHIQYVSPYFEALSGYRLADLKGRDWFSSCLPARDQERIRTFFHQASEAVLTSDNTNPIVTCRGEERDIEWRNQAQHDADGNLYSLLCIGVDVTERQQAAEKIRISEARLNEAQHITKVGSWELDLANGGLFWTDEVFNLFEMDKTRFDANYETFLGAIHPDDRDTVNAAYTQSLADRRPYAITHRLRMSDGRTKWVEERCVTTFDTDGTPLRSQGTIQDITERRNLEDELKNLNQSLKQRVMERTTELERQSLRNESIIQAAMDGFFIADLQGRMVDCNDIYCTMLGYDRAEFLVLGIPDIEANENLDDVAAHIQTIMASGQDRFDTRHRRKDGSLLDVEVNVTLVKLGDAQLFYAFVRDITPRKQAETALLHSRDEAERANAAKSEFLSRMSHELRTPLNAILGFAQLLEIDVEQSLTQTQADNIREIMFGGRHLLALVNEVLDLTRIESGRLDIKLEPITIAPLIESCVAQIRPLAAQQALHIKMELDASCTARADYTRLKQVLLNLLSNAVKYNREGGAIKLGCQIARDGQVRISVQDTGIGIAPEAMPRMFEPFERLETAYSGIEGVGIGLALSKRLVEAMSGSIGAESLHGIGSTFWVELPQASAQQAPCGRTDTTQLSAETTARPRPLTLLYVEDNPANLRLMHSILAHRKHLTLIDAHTGELGIELAKQHRPDLILLDINLPGMSGFEVLRHLRSDPLTWSIPIIAVSANAMPRDVERARAAGFTDYLIKPIDISKFFGILELHLPVRPDNDS